MPVIVESCREIALEAVRPSHNARIPSHNAGLYLTLRFCEKWPNAFEESQPYIYGMSKRLFTQRKSRKINLVRQLQYIGQDPI